ncbi:hypothetical protein [uncultured Gimesia sp.]|uniref:hypothetical protein n=1 Tax=uncultured Gimesia sp. TaxID=1678688 RepID=UPI0030D924EC|tara:strand:- start:148522 stop:149964 length:1443 start_codon:yes stop_codon:yes gene_type:complete
MTKQREPEPQRRSWPRRLLNRMEVNRAVFYALVNRGWQFLSGPVTLLLIVAFFSSETQGFYYNFGALIALQTFVEMGMQVVTLYLASHEWSELEIDERGYLTGDVSALSRLRSLASLVVKWYAVAGTLFVGAIGVAGYFFLSSQPAPDVSWRAPWFCAVGLTALSLIAVPCLSLLDGCNQVAVTNRYRALQGIMGTLVVWICISSGAGLWTCVAISAVRLFWELWIIFIHYRHFFFSLLQPHPGPQVDWSEEIWPLHWKLAIQAMAAYFTSSFVIPLMFNYQGAEVSGQLGMTWTSLITLQLAAYAWLLSRAPLFGILVSQNDIPELNRVFRRLFQVSTLVLLTGGTVFCLVVWMLQAIQGVELPAAWQALEPVWNLVQKVQGRILPLYPTVLLTLAIVPIHISQCVMAYIRPFKQEPFLVLNTTCQLITGLLVWYLGKNYGPVGAGWGFLIVGSLLTVPGFLLILKRFVAERKSLTAHD